MRTTVVLFAAAAALASIVFVARAQTPLTPNTGSTISGTLMAAVSSAPSAAPARTSADMSPVSVNIPIIGLSDPIQNMGVLTSGALAVPSGSTNNVGWYAAGTLPGQVGSAVLDAHVFAAFKNLGKLKSGDDIYIEAKDGTVEHFVVQKSVVYPLAQTPANLLFNQTDQARLNLITCAGKLTADHSTYDHRLIVYAVLAS